MEININKEEKDQFEFLKETIEEKSGILIKEREKSILIKVINDILSDERDFNHIINQLKMNPLNHPLWQKIIQKIVVPETYFFRDKAQFEILANYFLPKIERHKKDHSLRIWSAGCASGEETYSIAILLKERLHNIEKWDIFIIGTDINIKLLETAKLGIYRKWSFRDVEKYFIDKYFTKQGSLLSIKPEIANMVKFEYLNLLEESYPSLTENIHSFDLIICKNVLMYLKKEIIPSIVKGFYKCLLLDGWLILSSVETSYINSIDLTKESYNGLTIYKKTEIPQGPNIIESFENYEIKNKNTFPETHKKDAIEPLPHEDIEKKEELKVNDFIRKGKELANKGQLDDAIFYLKKALQKDPFCIEAHLLLAMVYQEKDDLKGAISELKKALYIDNKCIPAHLRLANIYQRVKNDKLYKKHLEDAMKLLKSKTPDEVFLANNRKNIF